MAVRNIIGFEAGNTRELYSSSGTLSIQSAVARSGGYALRVNPTGSGTGKAVIYGISTSGAATNLSAPTVYVRFYFLFAQAPAASEEFFGVYSRLYLRLTPSGTIEAYDYTGTALLASGTTALSPNTWYRIEVYTTNTGGSTLAQEVRIDGTTEMTCTGMGASGVNSVNLGKGTNRNSSSVDFYYDDVRIDDDAWPGPGKIALMRVSGDGTYTGWTSNGGPKYMCVDEWPDNATSDYIHTSTPNTAYSATLGVNPLVTGVIPVVKAVGVTQVANGAQQVKLRLKSSATNTDTAGKTTTSYSLQSMLLTADPATGSAWTPEALTNLEVGVVSGTNSYYPAACTALGLMVEYAPPSGLPAQLFANHVPGMRQWQPGLRR